MYKTASRLDELVTEGIGYIRKTLPEKLEIKPSPDKWSKKEILGHLIDSAINNLQRFTEIQFTEKPYTIRTYNQDELVKANDYQNADINEILNLWIALNTRIKELIIVQPEASLNFSLILPDGQMQNLKFLIEDYVDHLKHHLDQIMK